jgi:hypothetical protein
VKGARVRVSYKQGGMKFGVVVAESDECVGVRFDDRPDVPVIVKKSQVGVVLT